MTQWNRTVNEKNVVEGNQSYFEYDTKFIYFLTASSVREYEVEAPAGGINPLDHTAQLATSRFVIDIINENKSTSCHLTHLLS